ncbi:MAG: hypothetical protein GX621_01640 [Pirellulaceae bacterium]|nr:hypothetical protein [Pirellulaceae bacterium]
MEPSYSRVESRPRRLFLLLLPVYAVLDSLIPIAIYRGGISAAPVLISLAVGVVFAQVGLLTIWVVLGPFGPWARWTAALATSVVLCFSFYLGALIAFPYSRADQAFEVIALAMLVPLLLLVVQIPLWIRRSISGWRIVPAGAAAARGAIGSRQFGVIHVLLLTTLVSVALSLAKTAMPFLEPPVSRDSPVVGIYPHTWADLGTLCVMVLLYNTVWMGPSLRFCFLTQDKKAGVAAMLALWFGVSVLVIAIMTVIATVSGAGATPQAVVTGIFVAFGATVVVLTASLHLLRVSGYTMIQAGTAGLFDRLVEVGGRRAAVG